MSDKPGDNQKAKDAKALAEENARLQAEVEALEAEAAKAKRIRTHKIRRIATPILITLTCLSLVGATLAVWVNRTLWNEDKYISTVVPLANDPAVINAMATQLTNEAFLALNVPQRVQDALAALADQNSSIPPEVSLLAAPLTDQLHSLVRDQVVKFLSSDAFQQYWAKANEALHPKIVALLNGDYSQLPNLSVVGRGVQINLIPIVTQILRDLGQQGLGSLNINVTIPDISTTDATAAIAALSTALNVQLPPDFGQVTIMTQRQLQAYQEAAQDLKTLAWGLLLLTIILAAASIVVSMRRRRAVVWLGLGSVVALFLGGVALRNLGKSILAQIRSDEAHAAAKAVFTQLGGSLRHTGMLVGWTALLIAIFAYLAGRPAWLSATIAWGGRMLAPQPEGSELEHWIGRRAEGSRIGAAVIAVLVLFIAGITLLSVIVVGGLFALAMWGIAIAQQRVGVSPPSRA